MFAIYELMGLKAVCLELWETISQRSLVRICRLCTPSLLLNAKACSIIVLRFYAIRIFPADAPSKEHPEYHTPPRTGMQVEHAVMCLCLLVLV